MAHLTSPIARIECRDAATCAWHECADNDTPAIRLEHVAQTLRGMGFTAGIAPESDYTVATVFVTDNVGAGIRLEFDPMQDGFDYDDSGDDALALEEPADPVKYRAHITVEFIAENTDPESEADEIVRDIARMLRHRGICGVWLDDVTDPNPNA